MATITIKAWVYDTEGEVQAVIASINATKGYPSEGAQTYCSYELNNGKYIIKRTLDMDINFALPAQDFEYLEPDL